MTDGSSLPVNVEAARVAYVDAARLLAEAEAKITIMRLDPSTERGVFERQYSMVERARAHAKQAWNTFYLLAQAFFLSLELSSPSTAAGVVVPPVTSLPASDARGARSTEVR